MSLPQGPRKLTGDNLKVVWVEFYTLNQAVLVVSAIVRYR
jgi:hypothetical protein